MQQATQSALDPVNPVPPVAASSVDSNCTKPERPVRIYSHWGSPLNNVGEDGDYVFEEITGALIGPKKDGRWPEDLVRIEGPVVGKRGYFPRWRSPEKQDETIGALLAHWYKKILRVLLTGAA